MYHPQPSPKLLKKSMGQVQRLNGNSVDSLEQRQDKVHIDV